MKIVAKDFRVLENLDWTLPEGVCLLAGANGTGKTTTLDVLRFLRALWDGGHESALNSVGGAYLKRTKAGTDTPVELEVVIEDIRWKLHFPMSERGLRGSFGEELYRAGELILRSAMFEEGWYLGKEWRPYDPTRCCTRILWDRGESTWMRPLVDVLGGIRVYSSYWMNMVYRPEAIELQNTFLHGTGKNIWSVLANWKASPLRYKGQFDWVMEETRKAMPGLVGQIEFDRGQTYLFPPDATDPAEGLPPARMADGLLTTLLHLTAVAGAPDGAILAFDEMENQLHPHAIRSIVRAMRERAEAKNLTIILTTHSPVLMTDFRKNPEQFFLMEAGYSPLPVALTTLHDEDWLAAFDLGDLYARLEFGSRKGAG